MTSHQADVTGEPVRQYVRENFLYARPEYPLGDDTPLLDEGIIDSMGVIELVEYIQTRFGVAVADHEITEDNFGTLRRIAEFVRRKRDGRG